MKALRSVPLLLLAAGCAGGATGPASPGESARVAPALAEIDLALAQAAGGAVHERWVQASRAAPEDPVAAFLAAASLADREASWKALRDRADHHPKEAWPHYGMARIYAVWDTWDQAAMSMKRALDLAPGEPLLQVLQAEAAAHGGDRPGARARLAEVVAAHPELAEGHAALGRTLRALGDAAGARRELDAALRIEPRDLASRSELGELCAQSGDAACARSSLEELAKLVPGDGAVQLRLADARFAAGDRAGAAPAFDAGQVVEKGDEAQVRRALEAFRDAGASASELAALGRLDRLHPGDVTTLRRIAELKVATGASAESAYAALFEVAPDDPVANLSVARAAAAKGELYRAAVSYRRALAGGAEDARPELEAIEQRAGLARPAIDGHGSVNTLATRVLNVVAELAKERRKANPRLGGSVTARVSVSAAGKASKVEIVDDSTKDPAVVACVYLNLLDARYPARAAEYKLEIPVK